MHDFQCCLLSRLHRSSCFNFKNSYYEIKKKKNSTNKIREKIYKSSKDLIANETLPLFAINIPVL